jgi:hypothetical protein
MPNSLSNVFSVANLKKSFQGLLLDSDPSYKNYFRHLYHAYALNASNSLEQLSKKLIEQSYDNSRAVQILPVKKSGLRRNWTLLSIEDQIVYQAVALEIKSKIHAKVSKRYTKNVFGHMLSPVQSIYFFQKWNKGYACYIQQINRNIEDGKKWCATFDIASCYDTINHNLLERRLIECKLDRKIIQLLMHWLLNWNNSKYDEEFDLKVGIPQGPMASKLLAETVLSFYDHTFDDLEFTYFRYVDDIVLLGETEKEVRCGILKLDQISKTIGMIPAAEKIKIEEVNSYKEVIKSVDDYQDSLGFVADGEHVSHNYDTLKKLTQGGVVHNETRFKYVLNRFKPYTPAGKLVARLLPQHLHLHPTIARYLGKFKYFSEALSKDLFELLSNETVCVYPDVIASILNACSGKVEGKYKSRFIQKCKYQLEILEVENQSLLLEALINYLAEEKSLTKEEFEHAYSSCDDWWTKTKIMSCSKKLQKNKSSTVIKNSLSSDNCLDVALIAADIYKSEESEPLNADESSNLHEIAQFALETIDLENSATRTGDPLAKRFIREFGNSIKCIKWRNFINDDNIYRELTKEAGELNRRSSYHPNEWIKQLDNCNDQIVINLFDDSRFKKQFNLGKRKSEKNTGPWNFGSVLGNPTSRFAEQFPLLHSACTRIHLFRNKKSHSADPTSTNDDLEDTKINVDVLKVYYKELITKAYLEMYNTCFPQ